MKRLITLLLFNLLTTALFAQKVGAPCEGCEALYEYGDRKLSSVDTLPGFTEARNQMLISGIVYELDGTTPAKNVVLYIYQTDKGGIYPKKGDEKGWARRHGYLRGWVKTDHTGRYSFYTFKPGSYPSRTEPAHVHITVKEPDKNEYWIDAFLFDGDPLLTDKVRKNKRNIGGSGIIRLKKEGDLIICKRDIILGLNVPNYPKD